MTDKAKRTIKEFNFESEGAHLALVDKAANLQEVLVMKALHSDDEMKRKKKKEEEEALQKDSQPSVESQGEDVVKAEGNETINKQEDDQMTDQKTPEVTQEALEEQINKAAESIVAKRMEELEKSYTEKMEAASKEVEMLKSREAAREHQEYMAKAEGFAKYLGEDADKEAIAKALKSIEASEESAPMMDVLKALKDTVEKDAEGIFDEIGKSATKDQPTDMETKVEAVQKEIMKSEGLTEHAAYVRAFDQVRAESK